MKGVYRVIVINAEALEVAHIEGLRATTAFFWMGCLLSGPRAGDIPPSEAKTHIRELADCWAQWRAVVDRLSLDVLVENEARARLERQYFGGHNVLFADASEAWAGHVDMVERLTGLGEAMVLVDEADAPRRSPGGVGVGASIEARVADRVARLADDARVRAYETLGERLKAVQIMERRLLPD